MLTRNFPFSYKSRCRTLNANFLRWTRVGACSQHCWCWESFHYLKITFNWWPQTCQCRLHYSKFLGKNHHSIAQHSTLSFSWFYKSQSSFSALTFSFKPLVFPSAPNPGWYPWSLSAQGKGSLGPQIWYWLPGWVNQCVSQGLMLPSTSHSWTNNEESCIYGSVWAFTFGSVGVFCL